MPKKKKSPNLNNTLTLLILLFLLIMIPLTIMAFNNFRQPISEAAIKTSSQTTNHGTPRGPHYNLNIIGVPKGKSPNLSAGGELRIFVSLQEKTKINLYEADQFEILDANGTIGSASFQLPNPDPDNDGATTYSIWARPLSKPKSKSTTTCAKDEYGIQWCKTEALVLVGEKGKSSFSEVSKQLLYIYVDLDNDGDIERYPIFDDSLMGYFWDYDNQGMKIVQLRFYEIVPNIN